MLSLVVLIKCESLSKPNIVFIVADDLVSSVTSYNVVFHFEQWALCVCCFNLKVLIIIRLVSSFRLSTSLLGLGFNVIIRENLPILYLNIVKRIFVVRRHAFYARMGAHYGT